MGDVTATTCTNGCGRPATTTWGFPVCQKCHDGLEYLHRTLNEDAEERLFLPDECIEPGDVVCPRLGNCTNCADENDRSTDA